MNISEKIPGHLCNDPNWSIHIYCLCNLVQRLLYIYIYIYNFEWRNWYIMLEITMTRKSGKHLHVTYVALNSCFDLIRSYQQCTLDTLDQVVAQFTMIC